MTKTNTQPEEAFEIGTLHHLVAGNSARLKDARGTPAKIVDVRPATGVFVVEIQDFEDKGAKWEESLENVRNYQFVKTSPVASDEEVAELEAAVAQFDRPLSIKCDSARRTETVTRLVEERRAVGAWLSQNSRFLAERRTLPPVETRQGAPQLCEDLRKFMNSRGLWEMEDAFARQYVSYPHSGELVKGHRIVLAEMGLVPYDGKVIRNPDLFDGFWSKEQRARHILARLAFVHEVFARLGISRLILYRGISRNGRLIRHQNHTFVSSTFSREVAEAHFDGRPQGTGVLYRQNVSVQRVFMTYFETVQMNRQYKEAEAILLFDNGNLAF
jgi:hypothetical protein